MLAPTASRGRLGHLAAVRRWRPRRRQREHPSRAVGAAAPCFSRHRRGKYAIRLETLPKRARANRLGLWRVCPGTRYNQPLARAGAARDGGRSHGPRLSDLAVSVARSAPPFVYLPLGGSGPHGTVVMLPAASLASSEGWPPVLILVVRTPGPGRRSEPGLPGSTVSFT
jgi:hypothetical protein